MNSNTWDCCRMCLGMKNLHPIFSEGNHHELFSSVIFTVTGLKVNMNDNLPQQICSVCINFINSSIKFRKKCEENNEQLLHRLNMNHFYTVKIEPTPEFKTETVKTTEIDISHFLTDLDSDFRDHDDNITLDSFKYIKIPKVDDSATLNPLLDNITKETVHDNTYTKTESRKTRTPRVRKENREKEKRSKLDKLDERKRNEVQCKYCDKILTSKLSLRNHYKIHTGFDVVCEHCGKKFITRRLLLMHCRAKHGYEKTDKCSYCDYRASNAEQVKIHERLHTGEKPYACTQCDAAFHRRSSYLQHIAIHLPEKTVQCDQCPARFKSITLMRIHKSRHRAAVYSFQCRVCEGSFARRRNVARHLLRVHNLPPDQRHIDRRKIG